MRCRVRSARTTPPRPPRAINPAKSHQRGRAVDSSNRRQHRRATGGRDCHQRGRVVGRATDSNMGEPPARRRRRQPRRRSSCRQPLPPPPAGAKSTAAADLTTGELPAAATATNAGSGAVPTLATARTRFSTPMRTEKLGSCCLPLPCGFLAPPPRRPPALITYLVSVEAL